MRGAFAQKSCTFFREKMPTHYFLFRKKCFFFLFFFVQRTRGAFAEKAAHFFREKCIHTMFYSEKNVVFFFLSKECKELLHKKAAHFF